MKVALLSMVLSATAQAAEIPRTNWQVRAELLVIRVPQQEGIVLASRWADPKKCETAFEEAQALLATGKATLVADVIAHGADGEEMKAGLLEPVRYSTEFTRSDERLLSAPKDGSKTLASSTTAFESRDCGVEFVFLGNIGSDSRTPTIRGSARNCWLERMRRFERALLKDETKLFFEVPIFHEANDHFVAHLHEGGTALIGTHLLAHPAGAMELRLLTARTRPGIARARDKMAENTRGGTGAWHVCCELHKFVAVDSLALGIREEGVDDARAEAVFQRLVGKVEKEEVELTAISFLHTLSGERAVNETLSDHRYDAAMQPNGPGRPISLGGPLMTDGMTVPFAFEHREVGVRTEIEPAVSPGGRTIELALDTTTVGMHGFTRWPGNSDGRGAQGFLYRPSFSSSRISIRITMESGARRCIGFQKLPGNDGRVELTFLKASTYPITR